MRGYIWLEGVDFAAHLDDTNDLSTRRGASLAYLHAVDWAEEWLSARGSNPDSIVKGASIGAWRVDCQNGATPENLADDLLKALRRAGLNAEEVWNESKAAYDACNKGSDCAWPSPAPFAHLSFVCGWAEGEDDTAPALVRARALAQQFRRFTLRPAGKAAREYCGIDRLRPAQVNGYLPGASGMLVSASVLARRAYGRHARQGFYAGEAGEEWGRLFFTNDFEELRSAPPEDVPLSASSKIAVFYADGNGFTALAGKSAQQRQEFSRHLRQCQQQLLRDLLKAFDQGGAPWFQLDTTGKEEDAASLRLRLETLLWGGDELMFVMPSWLGLWFARRFFEWVRGWQTPDGKPLTFGAGLLICNYKTPIRVAQKIAKNELAEAAKDWGKRQQGGPCNALSVFVMESMEPLEQGLTQERRHMLDLHDELEDALVIPADKLPGALKKALNLKEKFPRSQLYRLLHKARAEKKFDARWSDEKTRKLLEDWLNKAGKDSGLDHKDFRLVDYKACELGRRPVLNLYWQAELWDYLPPEDILSLRDDSASEQEEDHAQG